MSHTLNWMNGERQGNTSDLKKTTWKLPTYTPLSSWLHGRLWSHLSKVPTPLLFLVLLKKLPVMYWKICTRGGVIHSLSFSKPSYNLLPIIILSFGVWFLKSLEALTFVWMDVKYHSMFKIANKGTRYLSQKDKYVGGTLPSRQSEDLECQGSKLPTDGS